MNRLECIKSMVDKCHTAADIGTDHGYVAEMLLKDGTAQKVIATDLNKGPLNRAIEYLTDAGLENMCQFRLGSGLEVIEANEAESVVIAGMGGDLMIDILNKNRDVTLSIKQFILQPMTAVDKLRKYLCQNGFKITDENIVKEFHHYYFIIKAESGESEIDDDIYYEISKPLLDKKDNVMYEYIAKVIATNDKIISNLESSPNCQYDDKIRELKNKNLKIMELKDKYEA